MSKLTITRTGAPMPTEDEMMGNAELIERMRKLGDEMKSVGTAIDYYCGLSDNAVRGRELFSAGGMVLCWADDIEGGE